MLERLHPELAHPLRLVLELRDLLHDLAVQALGRFVQIVLGVMEAITLLVVRVDLRKRFVLGQYGGLGSSHYSTSSLIVSSSMITGYVSTGTYAGKVFGCPVFRSNSEPWRGHSIVHASWYRSPSTSGPLSCEHRSSIAYTVPAQMITPISR